MRYISELFREKQNQIIRPPLKLYFEINARKTSSLKANVAFDEEFFDDSVAPIVRPKLCNNEHYYAVLGDGMPVDDPNRICAPNNYSGISDIPIWSVPYGVTPYVAAGTEYLIGSDTYYKNFVGIPFGGTLSFKGGLIPQRVVVEKYNPQSSSWAVEQTVYNSNLNEEITFAASAIADAGKYRRFKLYSTSAGRYQLNWIKNFGSSLESVIFKNRRVISVNIDEETDLTSQTLPSYEITVVCLDPDGTYSPESEYWNNQFKCGMGCIFKAGYESAGIPEYVAMLSGSLKETPKYENKKITFKAAVSFKFVSRGATYPLVSIVDNTLAPGDIVDNRLFKDIMREMFDTYDVFHGEVDEYGSECNYYGVVDGNEIRQLVANAMGCFITAGAGTFDLHNTNDIQYKTFESSYLSRYNQSKNVLDSKPKVGEIRVARNEYTLSEEYIEQEADEAVEIPTGSTVTANYTLSFWAFGKYELVDAQATDPNANITVDSFSESMNSDGTTKVYMHLRSDVATTAQPIFRFYEVKRDEYEETEVVDTNSDENYVNNNLLVANGYNADKVKRVAQFMSDVSSQYEVDVIQDLSLEIGDIIRLETEKNVFKTCIITGMKFTMPGSKGHITCRKVFSPMDSEYIVYDVINKRPLVAVDSGYYDYEIFQTTKNVCIVAKATFTSGGEHSFFYILGASRMLEEGTGHEAEYLHYIIFTDDNKHDWKVFYFPAEHHEAVTPVMDIGTFDSAAPVNDEAVYGAMRFIMKLYSDQGMTSPINYNSFYNKT